MRKNRTDKTPHFTVFRSAAEEVKERRAINAWLDKGRVIVARSDRAVVEGEIEKAHDASAEEAWAKEGGHMNAKSGYIVQTSPGAFKIVLNHEDGDDTEQPCATVRQGEAIIRRNTPTPARRNTSQDRDERPS